MLLYHFFSFLYQSRETSILYNRLWPQVVRYSVAAFAASSWTLSYIFILSIMYLFHSPFRVHSDCRTDWYAQMMKVFQIWCAIVIICFHVVPHLLRSYQQTHLSEQYSGNYTDALLLSSSSSSFALLQEMKPQVNISTMNEENALNDVAIVFLPVFWILNITFLYLHKFKRKWEMGVTYGMSYGVVLLNSLLLSLFAIIHYAMCALLPLMEVKDNSNDINNSTFVASTLNINGTSQSLRKIENNISIWVPINFLRRILCSSPTHEHLYTTILRLVCIDFVFIWVDYQYKRYRGFDPARGILWSDVYDVQKLTSKWKPAPVRPFSKRKSRKRATPLSQHSSILALHNNSHNSKDKDNDNHNNNNNNNDKEENEEANIDFRRLEPMPRRITRRELQRHKWYITSSESTLDRSNRNKQESITSTGSNINKETEFDNNYNNNNNNATKNNVTHAKGDDDNDTKHVGAKLSSVNESSNNKSNNNGCVTSYAWLDFRPSSTEVEELKQIERPCNRPGMVPWFSTFIMNTTWQAIARGALEFLTFDVRGLLGVTKPKIFRFHFSISATSLPCPMLPESNETATIITNTTSALNKEITQTTSPLNNSNTDIIHHHNNKVATILSPLQAPLMPSSSLSLHKDVKEKKVIDLCTTTTVNTPSASSTTPVTNVQATQRSALVSTTSDDSKDDANGMDVWFDWIADIGDGFNSTYEMARLLAAPFLSLPLSHSTWGTMSALPLHTHHSLSFPHDRNMTRKQTTINNDNCQRHEQPPSHNTNSPITKERTFESKQSQQQSLENQPHKEHRETEHKSNKEDRKPISVLVPSTNLNIATNIAEKSEPEEEEEEEELVLLKSSSLSTSTSSPLLLSEKESTAVNLSASAGVKMIEEENNDESSSINKDELHSSDNTSHTSSTITTTATTTIATTPLLHYTTQITSPTFPVNEVAYSEGRVPNKLEHSFDLSSHAMSMELPCVTSHSTLANPISATCTSPILALSTPMTPNAKKTVKMTGDRANQITNYTLPRGSFVIVGGDLAYPNPTDENYTNRLFGPYSDALCGSHMLRQLFHDQQQSVIVSDAQDDDVAHVYTLDATSVAELNVQVNKQVKNEEFNSNTTSSLTSEQNVSSNVTLSMSEILHSIPMWFAIPGNHDWFDGLTTFRKYIVERSWIGGWLMPQRSSFFVLQLPYNWWILCGDTGHTRDIDVAQRNYFLHVIEKYMNESSCVILSCHEPVWVYDAMLSVNSTIQPELQRVAFALGTRLRLRIAGDIHHYSRHIPVPVQSEAATLIVSGGGGAFLHGSRRNLVISQGTEYLRACAFPSSNTYLSIASRLFGFRLINWKFDLIVGVLCFVVIFSMIPQSFISNRTNKVNTNTNITTTFDNNSSSNVSSSSSSKMVSEVQSTVDMIVAILYHTYTLIDYLFSKGIISLSAVIIFFICFATAGVENGAPLWWRALYSVPWTLSVLIVCCGGLTYLICALSYLTNNNMLHSVNGTWGSPMEQQVRETTDVLWNETIRILSSYSNNSINNNNNSNMHSMTSNTQSTTQQMAMIASGILINLQHLFYGSKLVECIGFLLRCLDPLETFAFLSHKVSSETIGTFNSSTTRTEMMLYYLHILFFHWILVTPLVSFIIGTFLFVSVTAFDYMYDAAYSAFQIEDYKHFIRFKIDASTRALHGFVIAERQVPKVWELDKRHVTELTGNHTKHIPPHLQQHPSRWRPPQNNFSMHMYNAHSHASLTSTNELPEHSFSANSNTTRSATTLDDSDHSINVRPFSDNNLHRCLPHRTHERKSTL